MKTSAVLVLMMCALGMGCMKKAAPPVKSGLREAAILKCVDEFRAGLVALSSGHPELATVAHFDTSHLGFSFVNNHVDPRIHISLSVEDCTLSELQEVPVSYEELLDIPAVVGFELECEGNPELRAEIRALYEAFKTSLRDEAGTRGAQQNQSSVR